MPETTFPAAPLIERIRSTMEERNLNQQQLAEAIGVSASVMSRIMSGERQLKAAEVGALADCLGVSTGHLLGRTTASPRPFAVAARLGALGSQLRADNATSDVAPVLNRARYLLELRGVLSRIVDAPPRKRPPTFAAPRGWSYVATGEAMAEQVRAELSLADSPIGDLVGLVEDSFGVDVSIEPLNDELHGVLLTDATTAETTDEPMALMFVNSHDTYGRQRYTIAHELGHLVFGDAELYLVDYRASNGNFAESRANVFAASFLAPRSGVEAVWEKFGAPFATDQSDEHLDTLAEAVAFVAHHFGLSIESAIYRCTNLGLLHQQDRDRLLSMSARQVASKHAAELRELEEHRNVVSPPQGLTQQALYAYAEGMIGIEPLAQLWKVEDAEELRGRLAAQGWVPPYSPT